MSKTFIYTNSLLVEKNPYDEFKSQSSFGSANYLIFEKSKETLPVSGNGWIEGQEYVDGKDFERQWQYYHDFYKEWFTTDNMRIIEFEKTNGEPTRQAAVLINPNNSTVEITDEIKQQAIEIMEELKQQANSIQLDSKEYWKLRSQYLEKSLDPTYSKIERDNCRILFNVLKRRLQ